MTDSCSAVRKHMVRASGPPLLIGYTAVLCALGAMIVAFPIQELRASQFVNVGLIVGASIIWIALFVFAANPRKSSRVFPEKKIRLFYIVFTVNIVIAFAGIVAATVFQIWLALAITALLLAGLAVLSVSWFVKDE